MTAFSLSLDGSTLAIIGYDASAAGLTSLQGEGPSTPGPNTPGPSTPSPGTPGPATQGPATPGEGDVPGGAAPQGNPFQSLLMFALIGAVIWFLIFAPERKARKKREVMLGAVKKGDKIVTTGGMHAEVVEVKESTVTLKAGETRLTFSRAAIHEVLQPKDAD